MMLHCYIISHGTKKIVRNFQTNHNYDFGTDPSMSKHIDSIHSYCNFVWQDPSVFLNLYLPLRLHPMTRQTINSIVLKYKPIKQEEIEEKEFDEGRRSSILSETESHTATP